MLNVSDIQKKIKGEVHADAETLKTYSRDASLFVVTPETVIFPKDSEDVQEIVKYISERKEEDPSLSVTARSAGTDMSGGPLNNSVILDFTKHMHQIIEVDEAKGVAQPGVFYRDFEKETKKLNRIMPAYTGSKDLCALGGMVANNAGGEKSIKYGKVATYVRRQKAVFADGQEYEVVPLTEEELKKKMRKRNFEALVYKKLFKLIDGNYDLIQSAKPNVNKNSAGYALWDVWDKENGIFDLNKLLVGSQGTLALTTEIEFGLVPIPKYSRMVVLFLPTIKRLGDIVDVIMRYEPESLESYDDYSMKLAIKFIGGFFKQLGFRGALKLGLQFVPDMLRVLTGGVPKLILLVEVTGDNEHAVLHRAKTIKEAVKRFGYQVSIAKSEAESEKYWKIRRESFNLLRNHVKGKRTAPFIDDIVVDPHVLPEFFPRLQAILDNYDLIYTIAGHAGNGNFHIIPLMDLDNPISTDIIVELSEKVYGLVAEYKGSTTAEHNDGIIRTPFLSYIFPPEMIKLFEEVKAIFDPLTIFNPGKKVGGTIEDIRRFLYKKDGTQGE